MALVLRLVADRREHRHLLFCVELREPGRLRMPHERLVLGEGNAFPFAAAERRAQFVIPASLTGASTERASQPPSMKIDTSTGCFGAAAAACAMPSSKWRGARAEPRRRTAPLPRSAAGTSACLSPVPAGTGMPGSIGREPSPGLGDPGAQQLRAGEVVARTALCHGQLTCRSGEVAISMRRAFWRIAR